MCSAYFFPLPTTLHGSLEKGKDGGLMIIPESGSYYCECVCACMRACAFNHALSSVHTRDLMEEVQEEMGEETEEKVQIL